MNYFESVTSLEELRKAYYKLAYENHDRGGETAVMQEINDQYEKHSLQLISSNEEFSDSRKEWEAQVSEELRAKIERIIHLPNIEVFLLGTWLWCQGQTFAVRDELKNEGFAYSHSKNAYYWHKDKYAKKSGVVLTLEQIRELWGREKVESEPQEQLN